MISTANYRISISIMLETLEKMIEITKKLCIFMNRENIRKPILYYIDVGSVSSNFITSSFRYRNDCLQLVQVI